MMTKPSSRHFKVEEVGDVLVVHFMSKKLLDPNDIQVTGEQLFRLVDDLGWRHLILDFRNVEYLSSTALGKFIALNKKVKSAGRSMVIRNINAQIHELFQLSNLTCETNDDPGCCFQQEGNGQQHYGPKEKAANISE
jgi:anti-sigma B factor antagonist